MFMGRSYGGKSVTSWSANHTRPAVGVSKPANMRSSVDLPQPDAPSKAKISPRWMLRSMLSTAKVKPKRLVRPSTRKKTSESFMACDYRANALASQRGFHSGADQTHVRLASQAGFHRAHDLAHVASALRTQLCHDGGHLGLDFFCA